MTEAIYLEVAEMAETAHKAKRQVSVSRNVETSSAFLVLVIMHG